MDEERIELARIQQLLEENLALTQETNKIVHQLRRNARLAFWSRIVIWALVIILPLLLLKPILNSLVPVTGGSGGLFGLPSQGDLQKALNSYQGK